METYLLFTPYTYSSLTASHIQVRPHLFFSPIWISVNPLVVMLYPDISREPQKSKLHRPVVEVFNRSVKRKQMEEWCPHKPLLPTSELFYKQNWNITHLWTTGVPYWEYNQSPYQVSHTSSSLFQEKTVPTGMENLRAPRATRINRDTDPLIVDILLMKQSELEKSTADRKYNLIGSFKAGSKDGTQWTLSNYNTNESNYNISFHFISTGYSTFLLVYDNSDTNAGVSIQLVDKELTNFAGETEAAFFKQFAPGGDFSNVAEEYGGAFNITSTDNIPVIISTQDGIFFSESSADVFNRFSAKQRQTRTKRCV